MLQRLDTLVHEHNRTRADVDHHRIGPVVVAGDGGRAIYVVVLTEAMMRSYYLT